MGTTKAEGTIRELAGDAQEAVGDMLDDAGMRLSGKAKALCGKSQQLATDAAVVTREAIADNPLATLGLAAGIGFALGALWAASRE
ncbi:CsbD family protein [Paraburkholderia guartelaensis]|uniref:CsbD family protein n=2 Tax=Paraburkholderia guartelaensis TaxID=2546446 RepID=A0A4R5L3T8_9BURK|nr:CsbD family protein [Paraburkholderia guartelaensis]